MTDDTHPKIGIPADLSQQTLDSITEKALTALEEFDAHGRKSIELSVALGGYIAMAKGLQPHGQFTLWCQNTLKHGTSQCALHRRLYEARDHINTARDWAKTNGLPHHDSESPERVLKLISVWKKRDATQGSSGKEPKDDCAKDCADKVRAILKADETVKAFRKTMTSGIAPTMERAAAAIFAHQCSSGVDLLSRSQEYLALLLNRLADQTCGTPQVSSIHEETLSVDHGDDGTIESQHKRPESPPEIAGPSRATDPKSDVHGKSVLPNTKVSSLMRVSERR
jgi:hypothetical protein